MRPSLRLGLAVGLTTALLVASPAARANAGATTEAAPPALASAHIRDRQVFAIKVARSGHSATERATHASQVLEEAVEEPGTGEVHVEQDGDVAIVYVGAAPVIQLGPEDAAADGDASVAVHAAVVAAHVRDAVHAERSRGAVAKAVFSTSLLVFSALMVFLALGRLGLVVDRARQWVASRPASIPAVRIAGIDVLRPTALRGVALGAIDGSRWLVRIGLVYAWLLFALSLFDRTRAYSERLTGFVLAPLSGFVGRLTASMPVLFLGAIALVVLLLTLRVISLFFEGVGRGEPQLSWLPADLASPTSLLVRLGLVVIAASVATPLLAGSDDGPLTRASLIAAGTLALAMTPILASGAVGVAVVFGRHVKVGDFVELGDRAGLVRSLTLLAVVLEDAQGCTVRVPHLLSLVRATRVKGSVPPVVVEVRVEPQADTEKVESVLASVAGEVGIRGSVHLVRLDADAAVYEVTVLSASAAVRSALLAAAGKALREAGVSLARSRRSDDQETG
jgi:small-conductance mechanosensitive channel